MSQLSHRGHSREVAPVGLQQGNHRPKKTNNVGADLRVCPNVRADLCVCPDMFALSAL
jgi:hypothetical protein